MLWHVIFVAQLALMVGAAGFAFAMGGTVERLAAAWWAGNCILNTTLIAVGWDSPTVQLVLDGICATGFLPFAVIFVSWWAGALTLLAASVFTLEAIYLLQEKPADMFYAAVNNAITLATGFVFLASGLAGLWSRRRAAKSTPAGVPAAAAA
jgi:hypothetical protein